MRPGDIIENAIWLTGTETPDLRKRYEADVVNSIKAVADERGYIVGPVTWTEKNPGDDRCPPVPHHIQGPNVRLLVAEAPVLCAAPFIALAGSFLAQLDPVDLARLRAITRRAYRLANPGAAPLSDSLCDRTIERLGPEAAIDAVRQAVDSQAIH